MRASVRTVIALTAFAVFLTLFSSPPSPYAGLSPIAPPVVAADTMRVPVSLIVPPPFPPKEVALTFDACPHAGPAGVDERVLSILTDSAVSATIFISGQWARQHPAAVRRIAGSSLFEVGNHSFSHPHLPELSEKEIREQLVSTERLFDKAGIRHSNLFRPPFVETSARVQRVADTLGLRVIMCTVESGDPDSTFSKERLVRAVLGRVRDGSVVVMHVNGRGWHTAEALPEIIGTLRRRGFVFRKVGEMRERPEAAGPGSSRSN